jgi:hypothetical protein
MDRFSTLLAIVILAILALVCGGLFSERITMVVRRRAPRFYFEGQVLLFWGLLVIAAFALGLAVMYIFLQSQ